MSKNLVLDKIHKDIIFVDCFNTVLLRRKSDKGLILDWSKQVGSKFEIEPMIIYKLFNTYMNSLSISYIAKGKGLVKFTDVVNEIAITFAKNIVDFNQQYFCEFAYSLYLKIEKSSHYVNDDFINQLRFLKENNCKVYIVSDYHCGKEVIYDFLQNCGVDDIFDDVFVSCDLNATKVSGRLYQKVIEKLGVKRRQIVMLGDNYHSDNFMSFFNGIMSLHINNKQPETDLPTWQIKNNGINYNELKRLIVEEENSDFSNHAVLFLLFCKKLYAKLVQNNVKNVFFMAREGQLLKLLFDEYLKVLQDKGVLSYQITTHYFYGSRNSIFNASLNDLDKEDFELLFETNPNLSTYSFLKSLNFTKEEINRLQQKLDFNFGRKIFLFKKSKQFKALRQSKLFEKIYNNKKATAKEALTQYLDSFNVDFYAEGFHLVDSGYNGTMQALFNKFFDNKIKTEGYYLGCWNNKHKELKSLDKHGLLFDFTNKNKIGNNILTYIYLEAEMLCTADHSRVDAYKLVNNKYKIVFDNSTREVETHKKYIHKVQNAIVDKFNKLANMDYSNLSYLPTITPKVLGKILKKKTKQERELFDYCLASHHNGFGTTGCAYEDFNSGLRIFAFCAIDLFYAIMSTFSKSSIEYLYLLKKGKMK